MKKTYIEPKMQMVTIKAATLLAGSTMEAGSDMNSGSGDSRSFSFGDEE